jgi:chromosome segregation ATPase
VSKRDKDDPSDLVRAAEALDLELKRFEDASESLEHLSLTSEKALQKAAKHLKEIVETEDRLGASVQALLAALNAARERQQKQAGAAQKYAQALQDRTAAFQRLLERYAALGSAAGEINELMQALGGSNGSSLGKPAPDAYEKIDRADERLEQISKDADTLARQAQAEEFAELARHADSLKQQLVTARGKLNLIRRRLAT